MKEEWKQFRKNRQGIWLISNHGRVKKNGELYTPFYKGGKTNSLFSKYKCVSMNEPHGGYIHRIVGNTFLSNPEGKRCINHIDGNKHNNHISNLEFATYKENLKHAYETGLMHTSMPEILIRREKVHQYRLSGLTYIKIGIILNVSTTQAWVDYKNYNK